MEGIINIGTFIEQLTHYIKIGIFINKGVSSDKNHILDKCINLHNKLKNIEGSKEISPEEETYVRRCIKRFNLVLKVNPDQSPIDIKDKENQRKMITFQEHSSLTDNDINSMITYSSKYNINIFSDVPLTFILREGKYQQLLWQYTRSLFYISQVIISKVESKADMNNPVNVYKKNIVDSSMKKLEDILSTIAEIEDSIELEKIMSLDQFLKSKLSNIKISNNQIDEAKAEFKEMFNKKGITGNDAISRMIDSITGKLDTINSGQGNILQNIVGIAQSVASEMRGEIENNPESIKTTLAAVTDIFKEATVNSNENENIPPELKNIFGAVMSSPLLSKIQGQESTENISDDVLGKELEILSRTYGLDKDEIMQAMKNDTGEMDPTKFEQFMQKFQSN